MNSLAKTITFDYSSSLLSPFFFQPTRKGQAYFQL